MVFFFRYLGPPQRGLDATRLWSETGRLQQAEGGLFCCARSRAAAGKKGVVGGTDDHRVRVNRGFRFVMAVSSKGRHRIGKITARQCGVGLLLSPRGFARSPASQGAPVTT